MTSSTTQRYGQLDGEEKNMLKISRRYVVDAVDLSEHFCAAFVNLFVLEVII